MQRLVQMSTLDVSVVCINVDYWHYILAAGLGWLFVFTLSSYSGSRMCLFLVLISFPLLTPEILASGPQRLGITSIPSLFRMGDEACLMA